MIVRRCLLLILALAAGSAARSEYIADTGRTEKKDVSVAAEAVEAQANEPAAKVFELPAAEMFNPDIEKAILDSGIDKIAVQSEGVNTSLRTFAEIQVNAITGKTRFMKHDPVYVVLGMIYQNKQWVRVPIIPVESAHLAETFGLDPKIKYRFVSPAWVMKTPAVRNMVMNAGDEKFLDSLDKETKKDLKTFVFRFSSFLNLPSEFKLAPLPVQRTVWVSPSALERPELGGEELGSQLAALDKSAEPYASTLKLDAAIRRAYDERNAEGLSKTVSGFLTVAEKTAGYMKPGLRELDYVNTRVKPFHQSALIYFLGFFAFLAYLITARRPGSTMSEGTGAGDDAHEERKAAEQERSLDLEEEMAEERQPALAFGGLVPEPALAMSGNAAGLDAGALPPSVVIRRPTSGGHGSQFYVRANETPAGSRRAWAVAFALMCAGTFTLVSALVIRFLIGGRMPVSNMYESITFALGSFAVVSLIFEGVYRRGWVGAGASFAGWALMTLANSLPMHMRKIEPLVAVLNSVWLNFHVTALLTSYSCFLLATVFGILFYIKDISGNRPGVLPRAEMFEYLTYRAVQIGWPLLTLGIFLGAVWANTAWGSYWSWDPKETWALITWLTYTIYLHLRMNLGWTGRRSITAAMVGFGMVLITYFGVSYLPGLSGGMHSYAEPISK